MSFDNPAGPPDFGPVSDVDREIIERIQSAIEQLAGQTGLAASSGAGLAANKFVDQPIQSMDPRLQLLVAKQRSGEPIGMGVSTAQNEVAVMARVTNLKAWEELSEVRIGANLGKAAGKQDSLVTGRIPVGRIEHVRRQSFVKSLKAAVPLQPVLHATLEETGARPQDLPANTLSNGGSEAIVGIIDYGCDFAHENFLNAGGTTRILSIWNQSGSRSAASPFGYGREISQVEINAALQTRDPYGALGYAPRRDSPRSVGTHGTHVMDIACGNGRGSGVAGVAPNAGIVFVDVSHADLPFGDSDVVGASFGDSTRLLEALKYIFDKAGDRPCVINISLGTNGGPHDGTTLVEDGIDRLLRQAPNRAVCIAASNSFVDGIHAAGSVTQNQHADLHWQVAANDFSPNEFELWYDGADRFDVELIAPDGTSFGRVEPGQTLPLNLGARLVAFVGNRRDEPNNHDNMIGIFLERRFRGWDPSGTWTVRIHGRRVINGSFHAWIERDNDTPSRFAPPHDNSHTIGSISCGHETIVVGSYDAHKPSRPISFFSSAGPTRDGRQKPELSAPGHAVDAAHSRTRVGTVQKSGTSMASPAVAGICALVLSEAKRRNIDLHNSDLRQLLIDSARRSPPGGSSWNDRYGAGRISAAGVVQDVIDMDGGGAGASASSRAGPKRKRRRKKAKKKASRTRKRTVKSTAKKKTKAKKKRSRKASKRKRRKSKR